MAPSPFVGTWSGTNGFRLMPSDPLQEFPATAAVTTPAGGQLTLLAYTWQHPDDGPQDGVLLIGSTGEGDAVTATWGDSWHQKEPMTLSGRRAVDGSVDLEAGYAGGWGWRIRLEAGEAGALRMRMDNVVPAEYATDEAAAGPYPAMLLQAQRV